MKICDRPGRYFAIIIFAPSLLFISYRINNEFKVESIILSIFGLLLFFYELFWISRNSAEYSEV